MWSEILETIATLGGLALASYGAGIGSVGAIRWLKRRRKARDRQR